MELALKSQHEWRTDRLYSQYFYESGMINIEENGSGRSIAQNYRELSVDTKAAVISLGELKRDSRSSGALTTAQLKTATSTPKLDGQKQQLP